MNANVCVPVRRRCVGIAVMAFVISAGCTPRPMPWLESATTIQPGVTQPEKPQPPHGFLSIETNPLYLPGFVYDKSGYYLSLLPNNTSNPTALVTLPPGEYIVVIGASVDPPGGFRQLQVRVVDGQITRVSKADISNAPTF